MLDETKNKYEKEINHMKTQLVDQLDTHSKLKSKAKVTYLSKVKFYNGLIFIEYSQSTVVIVKLIYCGKVILWVSRMNSLECTVYHPIGEVRK